MPFLDSLDIANRGCQLLGVDQIATVDEDSKANKEMAFAYDKVRRAELRRNDWRFAIRRAVLRAVDTTTMVLVPSAFSQTTTYLPGAIVADTNNQLWLSMQPDNVNNVPGSSDAWEMYFGPMTVQPYSTGGSYFSGELVYKAGAVAGSYAVYMSLKNANSDAPDVANAYDSTVTYTNDQVVSYSGSLWRSLIPINLGITPADGPNSFDIGVTYASGNTVTGSDHFIYSSVSNGNVGHDPTTDGGVHWTNTNVANAWQRTPTIPTSATSWRVIGCTISALTFTYPVGCGPSSQTITRNVFRLPAGFLKKAPQDPKAGSQSALGAPSGLAYEDWNLEGNYLVSSESGPIIFRFVADITRVTDMDDMFCEGLACRLAIATCEPLTQSNSLIAVVGNEYAKFMSEARTSNAIEIGSEEPPTDDYLTCRN